MREHLGAKLDAYVDGNLDSAGKKEVEAHVKSCATCKEELRMSKALADQLENTRPESEEKISFKDYWKRLLGRHEEVKTMTAIQRIKRIAQSNIHAAIDAMEDPSKMFRQLLREMEGSLSNTRDELAEALVVQKRFEHRLGEAVQKAQTWEIQAALALKKGREELARDALKEQIGVASLAEEFRQEAEKQKARVSELKALYSQLNRDFNEIRSRQTLWLGKSKQAPGRLASKAYRNTSEDLAQLIEGIKERYAVQDAYREIDATENLSGDLEEMNRTDLVERKLLELKKRVQE
jgi:phage shock protein A